MYTCVYVVFNISSYLKISHRLHRHRTRLEYWAPETIPMGLHVCTTITTTTYNTHIYKFFFFFFSFRFLHTHTHHSFHFSNLFVVIRLSSFTASYWHTFSLYLPCVCVFLFHFTFPFHSITSAHLHLRYFVVDLLPCHCVHTFKPQFFSYFCSWSWCLHWIEYISLTITSLETIHFTISYAIYLVGAQSSSICSRPIK